MQWSDIDFRPSDRTVRQFAGLWTLAFGGLAAYEEYVRGHGTLAAIFGVLALTGGPIGLVRPALLRPVYVAWMVAAFPIGWVVSRVILAAVYFGLFTPVALVFRLSGRDPLHRRGKPEGSTYFVPKPAPAGPASYLKQF